MDISVQDEPVGAAPAADSPSDPAVGRRLIGAGLVGLTAAALLPWRSSSVGASSLSPTEADAELLAFAQTVELAAVELYDGPLRAGSMGATTSTVVSFIRDAHLAAAEQLSALLGKQAPGRAAAEVVEALAPSFSGGSTAVAAAGATLENTAVETHLALLGQLEGVNAAKLVAAIVAAEARFAAVLADIAGLGADGLDAVLTTNGATALPTEAEG